MLQYVNLSPQEQKHTAGALKIIIPIWDAQIRIFYFDLFGSDAKGMVAIESVRKDGPTW